MSWSTELWDQFETVSNHTAKGIEFLEKLDHFLKDRCLIETEYAKQLRKLAKNYDFKKKNDEKEFTYCKAFSQSLKELTDMAEQHDRTAENLTCQIIDKIAQISKDLKDERKRHLGEGVKFQNILNTSLNQLDKSKKCYDKAFKESEKAHENYQKADKDLNLSRAELEKAKNNKLNKERACENSKTDYARQLQLANEAQRQHYTQYMPQVFQKLQDLETKRIEYTRTFMQQSAIIQKDVIKIITKCLDGIVETADSINPMADAQLVVDKYKSGMQPPDDIPFEDLSSKATNCETESTQSKSSSLKSDSLRSTLKHFKKGSRLFPIFGPAKSQNDYSELPPNQKRKKIQAKVDELRNQIGQAKSVEDGLLNMRQAYEENGNFGDPKTIESRLRENEAHIAQLKRSLEEHERILAELDSTAINNRASLTETSKQDMQNFVQDESASKSPSMNNFNHQTSTGGPGSEISRTISVNSMSPPQYNDADHTSASNQEATKSSATNRTSNSFNGSLSDTESINAASISADAIDGVEAKKSDENQNESSPANQNSDHNSQESGAEYYETPCDIPIQAFARALYAFKAEPAGSISMIESELFDVIEYDQGDGWTRVRRKFFKSEDEDYIGFVPTSYIVIDRNSYP